MSERNGIRYGLLGLGLILLIGLLTYIASRSAQAGRRLRAAGFKRVWNLAGGIKRWSEDVDPSVPTY